MKRQPRPALRKRMCGAFCVSVFRPHRRRGRQQVKEFVRKYDFGDLFAGEPICVLTVGQVTNLPYSQPSNRRIIQRNLHWLPRTFGKLNHSPGSDLPRRVMNRHIQSRSQFVRTDRTVTLT